MRRYEKRNVARLPFNVDVPLPVDDRRLRANVLGDLQTWLRYIQQPVIEEFVDEALRGFLHARNDSGDIAQTLARYVQFDTEHEPSRILDRDAERRASVEPEGYCARLWLGFAQDSKHYEIREDLGAHFVAEYRTKLMQELLPKRMWRPRVSDPELVPRAYHKYNPKCINQGPEKTARSHMRERPCTRERSCHHVHVPVHQCCSWLPGPFVSFAWHWYRMHGHCGILAGRHRPYSRGSLAWHTTRTVAAHVCVCVGKLVSHPLSSSSCVRATSSKLAVRRGSWRERPGSVSMSERSMDMIELQSSEGGECMECYCNRSRSHRPPTRAQVITSEEVLKCLLFTAADTHSTMGNIVIVRKRGFPGSPMGARISCAASAFELESGVDRFQSSPAFAKQIGWHVEGMRPTQLVAGVVASR